MDSLFSDNPHLKYYEVMADKKIYRIALVHEAHWQIFCPDTQQFINLDPFWGHNLNKLI